MMIFGVMGEYFCGVVWWFRLFLVSLRIKASPDLSVGRGAEICYSWRGVVLADESDGSDGSDGSDESDRSD